MAKQIPSWWPCLTQTPVSGKAEQHLCYCFLLNNLVSHQQWVKDAHFLLFRVLKPNAATFLGLIQSLSK